jgi:hypothetical protein
LRRSCALRLFAEVDEEEVERVGVAACTALTSFCRVLEGAKGSNAA